MLAIWTVSDTDKTVVKQLCLLKKSSTHMSAKLCGHRKHKKTQRHKTYKTPNYGDKHVNETKMT